MKRCIFIIAFGLWHMCLYAQIRHTVTFDIDKLAIDRQYQSDGYEYAILSYEDCSVSDSVGSPSLPYRILRFLVPNEPASFSIDLNNTDSEPIDLPVPLLPVQEGIPTSADWENGVFSPSITVSSEIYPADIVQILNEGYLDGDKRILTVKVAPVQYVTSTRQLLFHSSIDFTVRYNTLLSKNAVKSMSPIVSKHTLAEADLMNLLDFVENSSDINRIVSSRGLSRTSVPSLNLPSYEYVVITADSLAPYFKRLVDWKCQKGLHAGIVTMEDILGDASITGDEVSNLSDDAGKLRQYLRLAYQNGTQYVFLGGGRTIVPFRYGSGYDNDWTLTDNSEVILEGAKIPADLYFSDLNGNWNVDGDQYLGEETNDAVDYYPELYVGRLLCKNGIEINNYIDKLLLYEQNPGRGDYAYLKKAFYTQADQMQNYEEANSVANNFNDIFPTYTLLQEVPEYDDANPTFPTGKDVIDAMNNEYHGFLSWFNHGGPNALTMKSNKVMNSGHSLMIATEGEYVNPWVKVEQGNGINNMTNFNHPAIAYSIACIVTPYDVYYTPSILYDVKYNLGEAFTVAGKYGCAAFLGNTRSGWTSRYNPPSTELEKKFVNRIKLSTGKVGMSEALSKADYKGSRFHWLALTHNLIGCPEFEMWTNIPSQFENTSVAKASNSLTVNTGVVNTNIAVRGLFNDKRVMSQVGQRSTFWDLPKNYIVTLYKHDYLPYVDPIYLQNESVTGTHYIKGGRIFIGNSVDSSKANGDFVIKSGANVVLEISEGITLDAGTVIESGAIFEVKLNN